MNTYMEADFHDCEITLCTCSSMKMMQCCGSDGIFHCWTCCSLTFISISSILQTHTNAGICRNETAQGRPLLVTKKEQNHEFTVKLINCHLKKTVLKCQKQ